MWDSQSMETDKALHVLMSCRLFKILVFGPFRSFSFARGTVAATDYDAPGEWAVHVDCPWRLERGGRLLTGSADWAIPYKDELPEFSPDLGDGLQEQIMRSVLHDSGGQRGVWRNLTEDMVVESVNTDMWGGFAIGMTGIYTLRVFPCGVGAESWRLLKPGDLDSHFVVGEPHRNEPL